MKKLTKEEQKAEAWEAYKATRAEALQAYDDRIDEIDKQYESLTFDEQFNDPMEAIGQLVDEAKRLKEKYSDKEI